HNRKRCENLRIIYISLTIFPRSTILVPMNTNVCKQITNAACSNKR
ncbi:hypothetical protein SNEBB_001969, partial [Seison nebaliae]